MKRSITLNIRECGSTLYVGMRQKQNGPPYNAMQFDYPFKNHPEVFLGDLCIYCCQIIYKMCVCSVCTCARDSVNILCQKFLKNNNLCYNNLLL